MCRCAQSYCSLMTIVKLSCRQIWLWLHLCSPAKCHQHSSSAPHILFFAVFFVLFCVCVCVCVHPQLWLALTPSIPLITITTIITWAAWRRRHAATSTTRAAATRALTPAPRPSPILTGWTPQVGRPLLVGKRAAAHPFIHLLTCRRHPIIGLPHALLSWTHSLVFFLCFLFSSTKLWHNEAWIFFKKCFNFSFGEFAELQCMSGAHTRLCHICGLNQPTNFYDFLEI